MPFVNIQLIAGITKKEKQALVARITDAFTETLGKNPHHLHIAIQEIPADCWGHMGETSDDLLARDPHYYSLRE